MYIHIFCININNIFIILSQVRCQQLVMATNMSVHSLTTLPSLWIFIHLRIKVQLVCQSVSENSHAGFYFLHNLIRIHG